ncbi:MAG: hypothetical protein PHS02_02415 [Candidatus ainarchaeum sp.]|nr:hypothetical protein [Candidatus ainarchaeum sp.]
MSIKPSQLQKQPVNERNGAMSNEPCKFRKSFLKMGGSPWDCTKKEPCTRGRGESSLKIPHGFKDFLCGLNPDKIDTRSGVLFFEIQPPKEAVKDNKPKPSNTARVNLEIVRRLREQHEE